MKEFDVEKAELAVLEIQAQLDALLAGDQPPDGLTSEEVISRLRAHINNLKLLIAEATAQI